MVNVLVVGLWLGLPGTTWGMFAPNFSLISFACLLNSTFPCIVCSMNDLAVSMCSFSNFFASAFAFLFASILAEVLWDSLLASSLSYASTSVT